MRNLWIGLVLTGLFSLGCRNVEFENGEIPTEYLTQAKVLEGRYEGGFAGLGYELRVRFEGARPILELEPLHPGGCLFEFGPIKSAQIDKDESGNVQIRGVTFAVVSNYCGFFGDTFDIEFKSQPPLTVMDVSMLAEVHWRDYCYDPGLPQPGPPRFPCRREPEFRYVYGRFRK